MEPKNALFHLLQTAIIFHDDEGHHDYMHRCDDPDCQLNWIALQSLATTIGVEIPYETIEENGQPWDEMY